jgi:hypothetical protein
MDGNFHSTLYEQRCNALVAWYLGKLVPSAESSAPDTVITPEDLYEYLLIDNQVSSEVDTSRVAQGIACVQQHIHAIYNGMEPGFGQVADSGQHRRGVQLWQEGMSQYSSWAGYQMLADYPENYLDPSLRLGKTAAFETFENELSQSRLKPDSLHKALGNYLTRFEEVSNLDTVCCYIDGVNFRQADYYFIGRSQVGASSYYWRKAVIDVDDSSTHIPPSAWSEWKPVEVKTSGTVTHVRTVVVEGRLHLVWLEQVRQNLDADEKPVVNSFVYRLNVSYLQSDGQWSAAVCLRESIMPSFGTLESDGYVLIAAFDPREESKPRLVVGFLRSKENVISVHAFVHMRDKLWNLIILGSVAEAALIHSMKRQIKSGPGGAQHPIEAVTGDGKVWAVESVVWNEAGDNHPGALSRYLEFESRTRVVEDVWQTASVGVCSRPWYQLKDGALVPFQGMLGIWKNDPRSQYAVTLNGAGRTGVMPTVIGTSNPFVHVLRFGAHDTASCLGYNEFTITTRQRSSAVPVVVKTAAGGIFLDLDILALPNLRYVRLNTTFAAELVRKAERSLDGVLNWETQFTPERPLPIPNPPEPAGKDDTGIELPMDFNGANGRYFWELFFHVPHLAAWRLHQSFDHAGAEQWLNYLFNPQVRVAPLYPPPAQVDWLPYWTSRPLGFADDPRRDTAAPQDPDVIAYGAPSHYRKAIFMLYLDNLIARGDTLYRQVTRDALNEAKLLYARALSLLGPLSKGRSISQWDPRSLADAAGEESGAFSAFETSGLQWLEQDTPKTLGAEPWLRLMDAPWFRLPVNTRLLDLWDQLDARLYNLRNNLTLDGRPLLLALYDAPANPLDLLRAQLAGSTASTRRLGGQGAVPAYRFSAMLPRARLAVDTLIRFGDQVRQCMQYRDRAEQDALQQHHLLELASFVEQLDGLAVEQARMSLEALAASREQLRAQFETYDKWLVRDVSAAEQSAEELLAGASATRILAAGFRAVGHGLGAAPNTVTFTPGPLPPIPVPGGWNWGGPPWAAASVLEGAAIYLQDSAEAQLRADAQNRRREEWTFLKEQAQLQLDSLALQIEQQELSIQAAQLKRDRSLNACQQAQALYAFIRNRATNAALYQWLLGQMSTLCFQAYDAVLSLCLATEACWQYEVGDPDTAFIPVGAWVDSRQGLSAGESLGLGLLQMESAFLMRHERRLELVKTVSLRRLLCDYPGESGEAGWPAVIASLRETGTIDFALTPSLFDQDYPGHYLRQLTQVSLSLPGVLGPHENARAVLSQLTSSYLRKPDLGGSKHLYQQAQELVGEHDDINPRFVVANPRASQQVAISSDLSDTGLLGATYGEERFQPFEGSGAVSRWTLSFPRHGTARQQALLEDLQDVIVHVRYRAMDGGKLFAEQIRNLAQADDGKVQRRLRHQATDAALRSA